MSKIDALEKLLADFVTSSAPTLEPKEVAPGVYDLVLRRPRSAQSCVYRALAGAVLAKAILRLGEGDDLDWLEYLHNIYTIIRECEFQDLLDRNDVHQYSIKEFEKAKEDLFNRIAI